LQQQIGRYQILETVAVGSQGSVYQAYDSDTGQVVALKVLLSNHTQNPTYVERFNREGTMIASLDHPNIVKIFEVGNDGDTHFMSFEYLPESLDNIIKASSPMIVNSVVKFGQQICAGLELAHDNEIIHRDIKPQNILIGSAGQAKIVDFGIAHADRMSGITEAGAILGTPHYMSPEQALGKPADHRSDIYALGCLLYQMISGDLPFDDEDPMKVIRMQVDDQPVKLKKLRSDIPKKLISIIEKAMAKELAIRYQNISDLSSDLNKLERTLPSPQLTNPNIVTQTQGQAQIEAQQTQQGKFRPSESWLDEWSQAWDKTHKNNLAKVTAVLSILGGLGYILVQFGYLTMITDAIKKIF